MDSCLTARSKLLEKKVNGLPDNVLKAEALIRRFRVGPGWYKRHLQQLQTVFEIINSLPILASMVQFQIGS